jgi:hypothetical protein
MTSSVVSIHPDGYTRRLCIIASIISLTLAAGAFGAEWRRFFTSKTNATFYLDAAGMLHLPNGNVRAWEKDVWGAPDPKLDGETGSLWLLEMDCRERKYIFRDLQPLKGTIKSLKGVAELRPLWIGEWQFVQPSDLDEARYSAWCRPAQ